MKMLEACTSLPSPRSELAQSPRKEHPDKMPRGRNNRYEQSPDYDSGIRDPGNRKDAELPLDAEGKITCARPECAGMKFERRCEWSKHMDKHERPYVCAEPGCEKLRGFTYSGGLLRHQREVHKKHGGPKETLMCPYPYCKRNTGTGFTRKENLNEHIRRVHRDNESDIADTAAEGDSDLLVSASSYCSTKILNDLPPAPQTPVPPTPKTRKRKQASMSSQYALEAVDVAELRNEVKRLRAETVQNDRHIMMLEREIDEKNQRLAQLEQTVEQTLHQLMLAQPQIHPTLLQQNTIQPMSAPHLHQNKMHKHAPQS